jgi:hypothetical protein
MDVSLAAPAQAQPPRSAPPAAGLVLFIAAEGEAAAWPALAALGAADAVLHDKAIDLRSLAAGAGGGRAKKLAAEGWRVVRLIAGESTAPVLRAEAEELAAAGLAIRFLSGPRAPAPPLPVPAPQPFATALNGLAG